MYGEKEGFESFDDQNLFLFTDSTGPNIFVHSLPTTDAVFPSLVNELKVTGIFAKRADSSRFKRFRTSVWG